VIDLRLDPQAPDAYARANEAILEQGLELSTGIAATMLALIVWEGESRGPDDYTKAFAEAARERGIEVTCVLTTSATE
jgi:hypothetical protein